MAIGYQHKEEPQILVIYLTLTKSLHKSDEAPSDMTPISFTSGTFPEANTTTSTSTNYGVLHIKHSVAHADLIKLEAQSMNPDIAQLTNVFHTILNLN